MVTTPPTRAPRIFYGWYVLGVAMLAAFLAAGSSQLFMSIMLKPMTDEFGWSRTATTGAITLGTIVAGLVAPGFGRLADRHGPRVLMTLGALLLGGAYLALAHLGELWQFYAVYVAARGLTSPMLTGVVPMTAATNWFRRMRGRALGFVAMATPLGGAVLAFGGELIIERAGWQTVFMAFAGLTLTVLVVPAAVLLRRTPEEMGLLPDGAPSPTPAEQAVQVTASRAGRSPRPCARQRCGSSRPRASWPRWRTPRWASISSPTTRTWACRRRRR
jgi:MFS family permease